MLYLLRSSWEYEKAALERERTPSHYYSQFISAKSLHTAVYEIL